VQTVLFLSAALLLAVTLYTGCGLWLQKTGRI
jgi:outer membrane lipopolysaccharide assembly protein LptE/RlpB